MNQAESIQPWSVTVAVNGVDILTIETESLSGISDVDKYRREIIAAAENLLAFIGDGESSFDPYESEDYQRFVVTVAETCKADDAPCDSCLAGGICDGPNRLHDEQDMRYEHDDD